MLASTTFAACSPAAHADRPFEGEVVKLIVGFPAGGGYDLQARIIAAHLSEYLPGHPAVVVENMTGAGGLIAVNYLANLAKPDGLTIGFMGLSALLAQLVGEPGVQYDARQLPAIGALEPELDDACLVSRESSWAIDRWRAAVQPPRLGVSAIASVGHVRAALLTAALGLPVKLVAGYKGSADLRMALDASEVDVVCVPIRAYQMVFEPSAAYRVILQTGHDARFGEARVPSVDEQPLAANGPTLLNLLAHFRTVDRYLAVPPGTPPERTALLRRAFAEMVVARSFVADARALGMDTEPIAVDEVASRVRAVVERPESERALLKGLLRTSEAGAR